MQQYKSHLKHHRLSGEITVFISLISIIICSFILVLIKSARVNTLRQRIEMITDIALQSTFSEYNKTLFDVYGLLYIDSTYKGVCDGGTDSVKNHFSRYFDANISERDETLYGIKYMSCEITDAVYAVDNDCESLIYQIEKINNEDIKSFYKSKSIEECIENIEVDMRENSNASFDFDNQLESMTVTVYVEGFSGKVYECCRSFDLCK